MQSAGHSHPDAVGYAVVNNNASTFQALPQLSVRQLYQASGICAESRESFFVICRLTRAITNVLPRPLTQLMRQSTSKIND